MASPRCPICKQPAERAPANTFFPFCSNRCKVIDLAKWLDGDYRIPAREEDEGDGSGPSSGETVH